MRTEHLDYAGKRIRCGLKDERNLEKKLLE